MYTKERLLEEYNKYMLDENIHPKDENILIKRCHLLDKCFPVPTKEEFKGFDDKLKDYIREVHQKTISFYEKIKPALEGEEWIIESYIWPKYNPEEDSVIDYLGNDYNPYFRVIPIDRLSWENLSDLGKTDLELFRLEDENDSWGDYDQPYYLKGRYTDLHISCQSSWLRKMRYSMSDLIKIPGFFNEINLLL